MRKLVVILLVLSGLWSGYWYLGATAVERGLSTWLEQRRSEGWVSEYSLLETSGFPQRFETVVRDLELADPRTGVAWSVPEFRFHALAHKPNNITAVWPDSQRLATPLQKIEIGSANMVASITFEPGTSLTLEGFTADLEDLTLSSSRRWTLSLEKGTLSTRQTRGRENTHDVFFETTTLRPPARFLRVLDPVARLPDNFKTLKIGATIGFDAPWDRFAIEQRRPQVTSMDIKDLRATWGRLDLRAAGDLVVDEAGTPTGRIEIRATNWRDMLRVAVDSGVIPQNISQTIENALELLAMASGNKKTLDVPLIFKNGRMSFGPIPLGRAPRLIIR